MIKLSERDELDLVDSNEIKNGFNINIEEKTISNENYREVLFTTGQIQLVVMSLKPQEEIGEEKHNGSQFFRVEKGSGKAVINGKDVSLSDGISFIVPMGISHNVINTGSEDLKLYTVYSPPQHNEKTVQKDKE